MFRASRVPPLLLALLVGAGVVGTSAPTAYAAPCDWEWGGVAEPDPEPCPSPVPVAVVTPLPVAVVTPLPVAVATPLPVAVATPLPVVGTVEADVVGPVGIAGTVPVDVGTPDVRVRPTPLPVTCEAGCAEPSQARDVRVVNADDEPVPSFDPTPEGAEWRTAVVVALGLLLFFMVVDVVHAWATRRRSLG